jgi:hypothetical protein
MDYIEIILRGYSNDNDKQFLSKYFVRESKKAKKENYDYEEFFAGLSNGIERLKKEYHTPFYERKNELYLMLDGAKNGTLKYGNADNINFEEQNKQTIEYCNSELSTISFDNFPLNMFQFTKNRFRGDLNFSEVLFIEAEIIKANSELNKSIALSSDSTKKVLTNEAYYNMLEKCSFEAFESLQLIERYPKDGTKAIWDVSSVIITKGDGLPTDKDNEMFKMHYIEENMRVTFLISLESVCKKFKKKHSITRSYFYKKCYQSLFSKVSQSPLWNKPDFGFDINATPCALTFAWSMRNDIEVRSIEQNTTQQRQTELASTDLSDTKTLAPKYLGQPTNENANNFFDFLIEYYRPEETTQIKYVNILHYLKNDADKIHFIFNIKQNDYQEMIKSKGINISKFSKSAKYEEVEKPIFYSLENTFLKEMNK